MPFIIMTATAKMPSSSVKSKYGRVVVVEVEVGASYPKMISERAKGVIRIVKQWDKLYWGGPKSAMGNALREAELLVISLTSLTGVSSYCNDCPNQLKCLSER